MTNKEINKFIAFLDSKLEEGKNIQLNFSDSVKLLKTELKFMLKQNLNKKEGVKYGKA